MPLPTIQDLSSIPDQSDLALNQAKPVTAEDMYEWYDNNHGFPQGSGNDIVHSGWANFLKILADSGGSMEYTNTSKLTANGTNGIALNSTNSIDDIIEGMCNPPGMHTLTLQQLCKCLACEIQKVLKVTGYKNAYYLKYLSIYDTFPPHFGFPAAETLKTKMFKAKDRKTLKKAKLAATRVRGPQMPEPDFYTYEAQVEGNSSQGGLQIRSL